jgi:chromosome segregation ATPase
MKSTQMAGSECKAATGAAFNVYELGLKLNSMMDESFENEREVLKEFRETLGDMIAKREAKLNAMEAQLAKLKAALAAAGSPFAELKEGLEQHLTHVKNACATLAKEKTTVSAGIAGVVQLIQEHHTGATGAETGAAEAATGSAF